MGKTARRSTDELPSSPSSSPYPYKKSREETSVTHQQFWSHYDFQVATPAISATTSRPKALSQTKNVESKASTITSPTSSSKTSQTATQKPQTTTYRAFTTTYRSSASTRSYINYTNRSDKLTELDRLRMREEFYATYDVMTGIRIAATLGGFFLLMVFLIVYKSRSHSVKALKDPKIQRRAEQAVQEEEDREFQEAFEKTAFSLYQDELDLPQMPLDFDLNRDRIASLGNVSFSSCPPYLINPNLRFSSIGGYNFLEPPRRYSDMTKNRQSSLESSSSRMLSAYHLNDHYSNQNENFFNESDGEEAGDEFDQRFTTTAEIASYPHSSLSVPRAPDSRRSSGMTCCSTESSFLERRCSAITLGLSSLAPISRASSRRASAREAWEYEQQQSHYHHQYPGIHIIEATPKSSPCPSERQSHLSSRDIVTKDHIKVLDRFKRRRHEDTSIDSISEYPDEMTAASSNGQLSDNVVNANGTSNPLQQKLQQNCNNKMLGSSNNNNHHQTTAAEDEDTSHNNNNNNEEERRAPLASLSSFKMSSAECADSTEDGHNASVFDEVSCGDTDDDMEQFSTDSDEISLQSPPSTDQHVPSGGSTIKCDNSSVINVKSERTLKESVKAASEDIERQQRSNDKTVTTTTTIRSVNYSLISDKEKKSNSSECVAILDYNNEKCSSSKPSTSSAVILEMPVLIAKQEIEQASSSHHHHHDSSETHRLLDPNIDPSFGDVDNVGGGASGNRKWSKETLF